MREPPTPEEVYALMEGISESVANGRPKPAALAMSASTFAVLPGFTSTEEPRVRTLLGVRVLLMDEVVPHGKVWVLNESVLDDMLLADEEEWLAMYRKHEVG
jgi:hypothetical protein